MKQQVIIIAIILQCIVKLHCLPLPGNGEIIKYRVSSKYFNRNNATSDGLYNLLSQIHYGGSATTLNHDNSDMNNKSDETTEATQPMTTNESPETSPTMMDVTEQQQQQQSDNTEIYSLIEKVVNEQIEKLAEMNLPNVQNEVNPSDLAQSSSSTDAIGGSDDEKETLEAFSPIDDTTSITDTVDLDNSSTNLPETTTTTNVDTMHEEDETTTSEQSQHSEEEEENDVETVYIEYNKIPETLLNAVGDLLSSVLGMTVENIDSAGKFINAASASESDENLHSTTTSAEEEEATTTVEQDVSSSSSDENAGQQVTSEVDVKIENLANNFMTENTPEYAETVMVPVNNKNYAEEEEQEVLEAISPVSDEDDFRKPVSIEESVNHVMNLVKGTEGRLALEAAQNVVDSFLIDKQMKDDNVYDTLKGLSFEKSGHDQEMIKSFETDINEMINLNVDEQDDFEPNTAKAALIHKFIYGEDFK